MPGRWSAVTRTLPVAALLTVYPLLFCPFLQDSFHYPKFASLALASFLCVALTSSDLRQLIDSVKAVPWWRVGLAAIVLILISAILSPFPKTAILGAPYRYTGLVTFLCLTIVFAYCLSHTSDEHPLLAMFFWTGVGLAAASLAQFTAGILTGPETSFTDAQRNTYAATAGNIDFLAAYLLLTGIAGAAVLDESRGKRLVIAGLAATQLVIILSLCRGVWLAEIVALPWLLRPLKPRSRIAVIAVILLGLSLLLLLSGSARERVTGLARIDVRRSALAGDRLYFWGESVEELVSSSLRELLIGTGPDTFRFRVPDLYGKTAIVDKPHNVYLDYLLCMGVFTSLCLGGFVLRLLLLRPKRQYSRFYKLMVGAYCVQSLFGIDAILLLPSLAVFLGLLARNHVLQSLEGRKPAQGETGREAASV